MRPVNYICTKGCSTPRVAFENLDAAVHNLLSQYKYDDASYTPGAILPSDTSAGASFYAYATVFLPSANKQSESAKGGSD